MTDRPDGTPARSPQGPHLFGDMTLSQNRPKFTFQEILRTLFSLDAAFSVLRETGPSPETRSALNSFWADPALLSLSEQLQLPAQNWTSLQNTLTSLAVGQRKAGDFATWRMAAEKSVALAASEPIAATLVALHALMAWMGALGDQLHHQPWTGHHSGWHIFPLALSRTLVKTRAIWTARLVTEEAMQFIEASKDAYFNRHLLAVLAEYQQVATETERIYEDAVQDLAWELHAGCCPTQPNFRPEVAGLLWTLGYVSHAHLMSRQQGQTYIPPRTFLYDLIEESLRRMPSDPLQQYFWLAMKDRGPFDLRGHRTLFGMINARFTTSKLHMFSQLLPDDPCRSFARTATSYFGDGVDATAAADLTMASELVGPVLMDEDPGAYVRIRGLLNLIAEPSSTQTTNWLHLADIAATGARAASKLGIFEPFDRTLDIPFFYLQDAARPGVSGLLDWIEKYRAANLWYWLAIVPPLRPATDAMESALIAQEERLLRALRGAWFVTLLPYLPNHYRRYGFRMDEHNPPADGAIGTDPIAAREHYPLDESLARHELIQTWQDLKVVFQQMEAESPGYATQRLHPECDWQTFEQALTAHRR
jgi:hypothetical protein